MAEEILRSLGEKQSNTLEVMARQQADFQRSLVQTLSTSREPDPKFPQWDGNPNTILFWMYRVEMIKEAARMTDSAALKRVREAMGEHGYGHFDSEKPLERWDEFIKMIKDRFWPSDAERILMSQLRQQRMTNGDLNGAYCRFQAFRRYLPKMSENQLIGCWIEMLEPILQYHVATANPQTIDEAVEAAWKAKNGPQPPWLPYMQQLQQAVQTLTTGQLEQFQQDIPRFVQQQLMLQQQPTSVPLLMPPESVPRITGPPGPPMQVMQQMPTPMQLDCMQQRLQPLPQCETFQGPYSLPQQKFVPQY